MNKLNTPYFQIFQNIYFKYAFFIIIFLSFFPNSIYFLIFELLKTETFPVAILMIFNLKKNQLKISSLLVILILTHSYILIGQTAFRDINLYVNIFVILSYPIIFYFFYNIEKIEELKKILLCIYVIFLISLISQYFFEPINFNYYRGLSILSSEPSKTSISLFFLTLSIVIISKINLIIFFSIIIEIFFIKSLTGLFLWSLLFFFHILKNDFKYVQLLVLSLICFLIAYDLFNLNLNFINNRLTMLVDAVVDFNFDNIFKITGWRLFMFCYPIMQLFQNNFLGFSIIGNLDSLQNFYEINQEFIKYSIHVDQINSLLSRENLRIAPLLSFSIVSFGWITILIIAMSIRYFYKVFLNYNNFGYLAVCLVPMMLFFDLGSFQNLCLLGLILNKNLKKQ